ncbi:hypothetical protein [Lysobacter capsici]|uniref:hypothetical protein n=1 Tax=Lysobacter capsici TaxID=435897 RepID=UPI001BFFE461|nr:hypothetical protein [Lysobacter capsici]QWF16525.1 hypothetical protein KME82_22695 [Lysobacter capsici]
MAHASQADATSERWGRFMGDGIHAVDRDRLKLRADGLLESASRYPRTSSQGWTAEQNARGRYEYLERLIDCRSGLYVDTALLLLDPDHRPVARRDQTYEDQLQQIALRQDEVASHRWPDTSEIWRACALAMAPRGRDDSAQAPEPGPEPAVAYDYAAIGDAPPADARTLFERLRAQYDQAVACYAPPLPIPKTAATASRRSERRSRSAPAEDSLSAFDLDSLRHRGDGVIEATSRASRTEVERWPQDVPEDAQVEQVLAIDCRNGLTVPIEQRFRAAAGGAELLRRSAPVLATLTRLAQQSSYGQGGWDEWLGPRSPSASASLCKLAAQRCGAMAQTAAFEIDPARLSSEPGAPLLLSARAIWLDYRASFVPSCPIGER